MKTFRKGGIHPPESKLTAHVPVTRLALPAEVTLMLGQHIGAPARPLVKKGDAVVRGQMVAEAAGAVSAPVHSPVSGTVARIDTVKTPQGYPVEAIVIKTDPATDTRGFSRIGADGTDIAAAVAEAGIVGMGGATFPTPVKLHPPKDAHIDTIVVNGAECEPYLTCDHALMLAEPDEIIDGCTLLMQATGARRCLIGIEANKPDAISLLTAKAAGVPGIEVVSLRPRYPQGGEKQLIEALTGRRVPPGALPAAVGVVVQNVATVRAISRAVRHGEPLMERIVTVTGPSLSRPGNFLVPLGTPLTALIEAAGGMPADTGKLIVGGPMMGRAAATADSFTTKGLSGLVVVPRSMAAREPAMPCVRCGRCVSVCPMGLEPLMISKYSRLGMTDEAAQWHVADCIECGSCSYICPSRRPLLDYIRQGKRASKK